MCVFVCVCLSRGVRLFVRRRRWAAWCGAMPTTWTPALCTAWPLWSATSSRWRRAIRVFTSSWRVTTTRWATRRHTTAAQYSQILINGVIENLLTRIIIRTTVWIYGELVSSLKVLHNKPLFIHSGGGERWVATAALGPSEESAHLHPAAPRPPTDLYSWYKEKWVQCLGQRTQW